MDLITPASDINDLEANVRWLRDREQIKDLYHRYSYGVDTMNFDLVRSVFHPEATVKGTLEEDSLDTYLDGIEGGLTQWQATMHFVGNQYVRIDGDTGFVENWVIAYQIEEDDSPLEDLVLGLRYQDEVVRVDDDWKIMCRITLKQWHKGPFPRPTLGPPSYPRPSK